MPRRSQCRVAETAQNLATKPARAVAKKKRPRAAPLPKESAVATTKKQSYCAAIGGLAEVHRAYHDEQYGFPLGEDDELFGRLLLEINQAGLSWTTILRKRGSLRAAYAGFDVAAVAAFAAEDRARLLRDPGVIRNRRKVNAAIHNANVILQLQKDHGSFKAWLCSHHPKEHAEWTQLFRAHFKFTGSEIVREFLVSTSFLPGAHVPSCEAYQRVMEAGPYWATLPS